MKQSIVFVLVCFSLAPATAGCSDATDAPAVNANRESLIGGEIVGPETYPGVVYWQSRKYACTGTFVTTRRILTAAHCLDGVEPGGPIWTTNVADVRVGPLTERAVAAVQAHPGYAADPTLDVGVIELAADADVPVQPLDGIGTPVDVGAAATAVGYGCQTLFQARDGFVRKLATAQVYSVGGGRIYSRPELGFALCSGDSGGPLFVGNALVGIASVSWITEDRQVYQSAHTDLSAVGTWLVDVGLLPAPPPPDPSFSGGGW